MTFTLFIILPTDNVCSVRHLNSGVSVREVRGRLELVTGMPAHIYRLTSPDAQLLHDEHQLVLDQNVWDGFILRAKLYDSWTDLFHWVLQGNVEEVYENGGVSFKNGRRMSTDEEQTKAEDVVQERGFVALFLASFSGLVKMCEMLINAGVGVNGKTGYNNSVLHAACCRDRERVVDILVQHGAILSCKNSNGDTPMDVARKSFSKNCVRKIRTLQFSVSLPNRFAKNTQTLSAGFRKTNLSYEPHPPTSSRPGTARSTTSSRPSTSRPTTSPRPTASSRPSTSRPTTSPRITASTRPTTSPRPTASSRPTTSPRPPTTPRSHQGSEKTSVRKQSHAIPPSEPKLCPRSSNEFFMWDTDNSNTRAASACKFRLASAATSSVVSVRYGSPDLVKVDVNPGKPVISWGETGTRLITCAINRQEPGRKAFRQSHQSILKKRNEENNSSVETSTCCGDSVKSHLGQSERESHVSFVSVPDLGKDSSVGSSCDERSVQTAPDFQQHSQLKPRPPGSKLLLSRQSRNESWKTKKRRLILAETQKKFERDLFPNRRKETFDEWLQRKRREERQGSEESDSDDSDSEREERNAKAFAEWMKRQRERARRGSEHVTVKDLYRMKNRPVKGLITTDIALQNTTEDVDASNYAKAYKEWCKKYRNQEKDRETKEDIRLKKEKLEKKRQQLLTMAISYDEWMEHTEQRKQLMKEILQASMEELNKIEEEKLKRRAPRQISFEEWKAKKKQNMKALKVADTGRMMLRSSAC